MSQGAVAAGSPGYAAGFPFALGCTFLVLICFPALGGLPGGATLAHAMMLPSVAFWFGAAATRRGLVLDMTAARGVGVVIFCLSFLILWAFLSVLDAAAPLESGRSIATLATGLAVFFLVVGTVTRARLVTFASVLCFALALTGLISVVAYFEPTLRGVIYDGSDRASGFFKNPNQFGMAISTALPVAAACALGQRGRRAVWFACLLALLLGLVMSGSKMNLLLSSATLAFVLCAYPAVAFSGRKRVVMVALSLGATAVLLAANIALLAVLNPRALQLLQAFVAEDAGLRTLAARGQLWEESLRQFMQNPIFGQGAGQPLEADYQNLPVTHSHNVAFDYLRTMGAPGFVALATMLVTVLILSLDALWRAFTADGAEVRDRMLCIGLTTGTLAYLAANFSSDSMGPSTSPFFWVVLFLGLASRSLLRARRAGEPPAS